MPNENPEGGLRNHRTEFVRESAFGEAPADPGFLKYSDTVNTFSWSSDSVTEPRRGLGSPDPVGFLKGPETHEISVAYALIKWFSSTGDAAYDGLVRNADNLLPASHTIVDREDKQAINADQTVSGNASYDTRIYTVANGGMIDEVAITGDPSDSQPVTVELTYLAQKVRSYQIDQPDSGTYLVVNSTSANDTSQTLTIEDEGAATTEDVALNGTSDVSTSSQFDNIDALSLNGETEGDVRVYINDGSDTSPTQGDQLAEISGQTTYNGVEGDLGVPALGAGSHEALSSPAPEVFIGDSIDRGGSPVPYEIPSATVTVANNIEETERSSGYGMALHPGNREITMEASMFGESMTHDLLVDHLQTEAQSIDWTLDGGTLTLEGAVLQDAGERAAEEGQAVMTTDNTFQADGITIA